MRQLAILASGLIAYSINEPDVVFLKEVWHRGVVLELALVQFAQSRQRAIEHRVTVDPREAGGIEQAIDVGVLGIDGAGKSASGCLGCGRNAAIR